MKKLLLTLMLVFISSSAVAEWVVIDTNEEETTTYYADPTTIRKSGNIVKMWSLFDLKTVGGTAPNLHMSVLGQDEYDCKEERFRMLYFSTHSKNMGRGKTVDITNRPEKNWTPIAPRSIGKTLWKIACGK